MRATIRVGILAPAAAFERPGGLQAQVRETMRALNRPGTHDSATVAAVLVEPGGAQLADCDLVHVFAAAEGSDRLVDAALERALPVLLSARLAPGWTRANGSRARVADRVLGNRSACDIDSGYAQIRRALQRAGLVVALDDSEAKALCGAFMLDAAKVRIVPQGVAGRFFDADPACFRARARIEGRFALMVGAVTPYNNQLGMARLLAELALPLVVIGTTRERDADYLRQLQALPTVTCLGPFEHDDRMLAAAYAAASVFVLPGRGAPFPLAVLEALAAGTPVVMAAAGAFALPDADCAVKKVAWDDAAARKLAISDLLEGAPPRARISALARPYDWDSVAQRLAACYRELLAQRG